MKNIAILGSTGSIGTQTLDVARKNEDLRVVAVSAGKSVEKLEEQIREFHPLLAAVWDEEAARDLKTRIADTDTKVVSGIRNSCHCDRGNDRDPSYYGGNPCRKGHCPGK